MINSFRFWEGEIKISLERPTKQLERQYLCFAIFAIYLSARFIENFLIETGKTAIGENVLHKILGIIILAAALKGICLKWRDIGFQRDGLLSGILKGMLLRSVCFSLSYGLELAFLALQDAPAHLELYISGFSLTGSQIKNAGFVFFVLCILFNIINAWMEKVFSHCNAAQELHDRRNVICCDGSYEYRLCDSCRNYGGQMGASLPHDRKCVDWSWRSSAK